MTSRLLDLLIRLGWDKAPSPSRRARIYKRVWNRS